MIYLSSFRIPDESAEWNFFVYNKAAKGYLHFENHPLAFNYGLIRQMLQCVVVQTVTCVIHTRSLMCFWSAVCCFSC